MWGFGGPAEKRVGGKSEKAVHDEYQERKIINSLIKGNFQGRQWEDWLRLGCFSLFI